MSSSEGEGSICKEVRGEACSLDPSTPLWGILGRPVPPPRLYVTSGAPRKANVLAKAPRVKPRKPAAPASPGRLWQHRLASGVHPRRGRFQHLHPAKAEPRGESAPEGLHRAGEGERRGSLPPPPHPLAEVASLLGYGPRRGGGRGGERRWRWVPCRANPSQLFPNATPPRPPRQ